MSSEDERYDLLIGFLEGELDDDERERVEEELSAPGEALERLEAYRGLSEALAELEPPAPSAEAKDRAYAAVLAAMSEAATAPPSEDQERAQSQPPLSQSAQPPQPAPRGQLLRFLSATAAAALVMISALFYLRGLEAPGQAKVASAPKKIALEEDAQDRAAPVAQSAAGLAPERAPESKAAKANQQGASPLAEAESSEAERSAVEGIEARLQEERSRLQREEEDLAKSLEKALEGSKAQREELMSPRTARAMSTPTPAETLLDEARRPAAPPARPKTSGETTGKPEAKDFGGRPSGGKEGAKEAPADAPAAGGERSEDGFSSDLDAEQQRARRSRKKLRGGAPGAKRKGLTPSRPMPESDAKQRDNDADGTPRQTEPQASSSLGGGGGGGGGGSTRDDARPVESERAKKGKGEQREPGGAREPQEAKRPRAAGRAQPERVSPEDSLRMRRLAAESRLQPAWIVTRGDESVLYVLEGSKLTQAPFPHVPSRVRSRSGRSFAVEQLQVTALEVQRRALATKRKPVDLRVLERREDLLEIAKIELASDVPRHRARSGEPPAPAGPSGGAPTGKKAGELQEDAPQAKTGQTGAGDDKTGQPRPSASPQPSATAGKRALPPPPGRERAALLLRLLGAIDARERPSRTELRRALRETERRQVEARRRR